MTRDAEQQKYSEIPALVSVTVSRERLRNAEPRFYTAWTHNGLSVTSVRHRTASAAGIEDDLSDSYAARKIALGMCADLAKDIVAGLTGNSEWRLDVLDNFGKPVFPSSRITGRGRRLQNGQRGDPGVRLRLVCSFALAAAGACGDRRHPDKNFTLR